MSEQVFPCIIYFKSKPWVPEIESHEQQVCKLIRTRADLDKEDMDDVSFTAVYGAIPQEMLDQVKTMVEDIIDAQDDKDEAVQLENAIEITDAVIEDVPEPKIKKARNGKNRP